MKGCTGAERTFQRFGSRCGQTLTAVFQQGCQAAEFLQIFAFDAVSRQRSEHQFRTDDIAVKFSGEEHEVFF